MSTLDKVSDTHCSYSLLLCDLFIHLAVFLVCCGGRAVDALNLGPPMPGKYPATELQPLPVCLVGLVFGFGDGGLTM